MRQYMRQRRLDGIARLESTRVQVSGWTKGGSASGVAVASKVEEVHDDDNTPEGSSSSSGSSPEGEACSQRDAAAAQGTDAMLKGESQVGFDIMQEFGYSDPQMMPSSGRLDPFNSYPLVLKEADHDLINHCK
jgi:hypothetical protein